MSNDEHVHKDGNSFNEERQYLEQLLGTRVNIYLVFVSFYFVAVFGAEPGTVSAQTRAIAFALGSVVSLFMTLSVVRTTLFVEHILGSFRRKHVEHPYSKAHNRFRHTFLLNISANWYTAVLPLLVTCAFAWLACQTWVASSGPCPRTAGFVVHL